MTGPADKALQAATAPIAWRAQHRRPAEEGPRRQLGRGVV